MMGILNKIRKAVGNVAEFVKANALALGVSLTLALPAVVRGQEPGPTIEVPDLPWSSLSTAVLAAGVTVAGVAFGVWAMPFGIRFCKGLWKTIASGR